MKIKFRLILVIIAVIISVLFLLNSALVLILREKYPESRLRDMIHVYFDKNLKRSVEISSAKINFLHNISIEDMRLSSSDDFNDQQSGLKVEKITAGLSIIEMFKGKLAIDNLTIEKPQFKLTKKYGKSYSDTFNVIINEKIKSDIFNKIPGMAIIRIRDASIEYSENFGKDDVKIWFSNINADITSNGQKIRYNLSGDIKADPDGKKTAVSIRGSVYSDETRKTDFSIVEAETGSFEIKNFNPYM